MLIFMMNLISSVDDKLVLIIATFVFKEIELRSKDL